MGANVSRIILAASSADESGVASTMSLSGEHDRCTLPALDEALTEAINGSDPVVTVDLSQVTFLGVAPIAALAEAKGRLEAQSRDLVVVSASRCARRVIDLCGLTELYGDESARAGDGIPGALASWVEVPETARTPNDARPGPSHHPARVLLPLIDLAYVRPAGS